MTFGEIITRAFAVETADDARRFLAEYTATIDRPDADRIARHNIGYCFGEGMPDHVRAIWESIGVHHPAIRPWTNDPNELFRAGQAAGERAKRGESPWLD